MVLTITWITCVLVWKYVDGVILYFIDILMNEKLI